MVSIIDSPSPMGDIISSILERERIKSGGGGQGWVMGSRKRKVVL